MATPNSKPIGYRWRSSRILIVSSITVALFSETFLYGFLVPILSYMLEERLHLDASRTQNFTTTLLTMHGFCGLVSAPIIAYFAGRTSSQRTPLLFALAGCFVGTLLIASTYSLWALYLGRLLQAIAGSATWVIGFALLANNLNKEHLGRSLGTAMSFVTAGIVSGPMVGGTLLELLGYWPAWSVPLVVLVLDIIARLVMVEPRDLPSSSTSSTSGSPDPDSPIKDTSMSVTEQSDESTNLLSASSDSSKSATTAACDDETKPDVSPSSPNYYRVMLKNPRILTSLANVLATASLATGFNNTLPVHLRDAFGWGSLPTGMMFLCLQAPAVFLAGPAGWLRDRVGLRNPATLGWTICTPLLLLLGIPGDSRFPWASGETGGKPMFTCCLIGFGVFSMLIRGTGPVQMAYVVNEMHAQNPEVYSVSGGNLRVFSMVEIAYSLGMMLGPLFTGLLFEGVGFFYMSVALSATSVIMAIVSFLNFDAKPKTQATEPSV